MKMRFRLFVAASGSSPLIAGNSEAGCVAKRIGMNLRDAASVHGLFVLCKCVIRGGVHRFSRWCGRAVFKAVCATFLTAGAVRST